MIVDRPATWCAESAAERDARRLTLARSKARRRSSIPRQHAAEDYDWTLVDLVLVNRGEATEACGRRSGGGGARALQERRGAVVLTSAPMALFSSPIYVSRMAPRVIISTRSEPATCSAGPAAADLRRTGETRSPPLPKPLRSRSREEASLLLSVPRGAGGYS